MTKVPLLAKLLAPHWVNIGYLLDLDDHGFAVQRIKSSHHAKPGDCFNTIVKEWINGNKGIKPKTWSTFIKVLEDMNLDVSKVKKAIAS